jgi:hypothetical protein
LFFQTEQANANDSEMPVLELDCVPRELHFTAAGGMLHLQLTNTVGQRIAVQLECSDDDVYSVEPLFAFLEIGEKMGINVTRVPDKHLDLAELYIYHIEVNSTSYYS